MRYITLAKRWVYNHRIEGGIAITDKRSKPYPEVTGYFIPTLLDWRLEDLACDCASELMKLQSKDGSFPAPGGSKGYAFDTGQVIRGLCRVVSLVPGSEASLRAACDWMVKNTQNGRLPVPTAGWALGPRGTVDEAVHLYALVGLYQAGELLNEPRYLRCVLKARDYYSKISHITDFAKPWMLSHFFMYIQEGLIDLNLHELARQGMSSLAKYQREEDLIPAYHDVSWLCTPGQLQAALCLFKLEEYRKAELLVERVQGLQNSSGGFYGSYGQGAEYFADEEPSWIIKFYLDARKILNGIKENDMLSNMSSCDWHNAITGKKNPTCLAKKIVDNKLPVWLEPVLAATDPNDSTLELGSGTGELSAILAKNKRHVHLLDFSIESLKFARTLFKEVGVHGEYYCSDILNGLPFPNKSFDCVWSSGLLEHFSDKEIEHVVAESARIARKKVLSLVPNAASVPYRLGKFYQEQTNQWRWGFESPKLSLSHSFELAGLINIKEFSIASEHALNFLTFPGGERIKQMFSSWYSSMTDNELRELNQGYLLVTVGDVPGSETTPSKSLRKSKKILAVVPNDPLDAYEAAGYSDMLTDYFNPAGYFDQVFCLSPLEQNLSHRYGMDVIPVTENTFSSMLEKLGVNIIRAYDLVAGTFASKHRIPSIPLLISVHDVNPERVPLDNPEANGFLSLSQAVRNFLLNRGVSAKLIHDFANRVDEGIFFPFGDTRARNAFRKQFPCKHILVHVGRKTEQKNLDTVIKSLRYLEDFCAIFIGQGNEDKYKALAAREQVLERCVFIKSVKNEDLAQFYNYCDVMCTPSRWEGFGIVFIEALACAAVVVSSDKEPMNEYIKNMENGILVKNYENPYALSRAIYVAVKDIELRRNIKSQARNSIKKFFKKEIEKRECELYDMFLLSKFP